jgi:hypothetical protein
MSLELPSAKRENKLSMLLFLWISRQSGLVDWNGIESESDERVMERAGVGPKFRVFHGSFGLFSLFVIQKLTIVF